MPSFNTQPPKGGWVMIAGFANQPNGFNTQPPKGGWADEFFGKQVRDVSTHSRLKAAGLRNLSGVEIRSVSTHSRLKAAGFIYDKDTGKCLFQHTAA